MNVARACLLVVLVLCLGTATDASGLLNSPWPAFRHDISHSGRSAFDGPLTGAIAWTAQLPGTSQSSPAVANGVIYVVGGGVLAAADLSGAILWTFPVNGSGKSSPAIDYAGTVYVGSTDGQLYAINLDGSMKWKKALGGPTEASPVIAADGTIYIGCQTGVFYAYRDTGAPKYSYTAGGAIATSAALATDGTTYFGCDDGKLYALKPDGTLKWKFTTNPLGQIKSSPSVAPDGTVYFGTTGGYLFAVNASGTQKWRYTAGGAIQSSPALDSDGAICFGARDYYVYSVSKTGSLKWRCRTGGYVDSSPAIDASGRVYVGCNDGSLYAIDPTGSVAWSTPAGTAIASSPSIGGAGFVYAATQSGLLCSFGWTEPPPTPVVTDDGAYSTSSNTLHASWTCLDPHNTIVAYEYAIGTAPGAENLIPFTRIGAVSEVTRSDLALTNGADYYFAVRAINSANQAGDAGTTDGIRVDFTPPALSPVTVNASISEMRVTADASDPESGIAKRQYLLMETPSVPQQPVWNDAAATGEITIPGPFSASKTYYVAVRATNRAGTSCDPRVSAPVVMDQTPPTKPVVTDDGAFSMDQTSLHASWSAQDPETGVDHYSYCVGTAPDSADIRAWTDTPDTEARVSGLNLANGGTYYFSVKAVNRALLASTVGSSDGIVVDVTQPAAPVVADDGDYTGALDYLHASYSASDSQSGIAGCLYCVGTSAGASDALAWTAGPSGGHVNASGFTMTTGVRYYVSVKVRNGAGAWSQPGVSDGIECKPGVSVWPEFRSDAANVGRCALRGPGTSRLHWRCQTQGYVESSPAVSGDGTVYIGSSDGKLYAITAYGSVKWTYQTGGCIDSSPAVGSNGVVYFGSYDGGLYCLNPDGSLRWKHTAGGMIWSSPTTGTDGVTYFGCHDGYLYALYPDGSRKWRYYAGTPIWSSPAVASDGVIYFGCGSGRLYAINPNGTLKWRYQTGSAVDSSPAVSNGVIYFGSGDGSFYAINADGTLRWRAFIGLPVDSSPAIGPDGTIYVGSGGAGSTGSLHAYTPAGVERWRVNMTGGARSSPAIGSDGVIYVGSANGLLYAIRPDGSIMWTYSAGQSILSSPGFAPDGSLLVGCDDGGVYCFRDQPATDATPPTTPVVVSATGYIDEAHPLSASWTASDPETGIESYSYAVGNQPGAEDVVPWTNVGLVTYVSRPDLQLTQGHSYYVSVKARNRVLLASAVGTSGAIVYLQGDASSTIGAAKNAILGTRVTLPGKIVTAVFPEYFTIEEPDRSAGIRCMLPNSTVTPGSAVNVTGKVGTIFGEAVVNEVAVQQLGVAFSIGPYGVSTRSISAVGVDLKGLLVRVCGQVTYSGAHSFVIYDGMRVFTRFGARGLEVRVPGDVPAVGAFVGVVGIPCKEVYDGVPYTVVRAVADPMIYVTGM